MPACTCPHCKTPLWVKDTQLNVAQGFVVCNKCEGLFKAKDNLADPKAAYRPDALPNAVTDVRLIHNIGPQIRQHKQLSRNEIADLLDNARRPKPSAPQPQAAAQPAPVAMQSTAPAAPKEAVNWTLASLVALTVLIMQLFYLVLS